MSMHNDHTGRPPQGSNWSRINQWVLWLGLAAAVLWLYFRHNEHLLQLLPFAFVLACPLMHLFGHGHHGGHGGPTKDRDVQRGPGDADTSARQDSGHVH